MMFFNFGRMNLTLSYITLSVVRFPVLNDKTAFCPQWWWDSGCCRSPAFIAPITFCILNVMMHSNAVLCSCIVLQFSFNYVFFSSLRLFLVCMWRGGGIVVRFSLCATRRTVSLCSIFMRECCLPLLVCSRDARRLSLIFVDCSVHFISGVERCICLHQGTTHIVYARPRNVPTVVFLPRFSSPFYASLLPFFKREKARQQIYAA